MAMMTTGKQFVKVPLKPFSAVCWAHDFEREGVHSDGMWIGVVLSGDLKRGVEFEEERKWSSLAFKEEECRDGTNTSQIRFYVTTEIRELIIKH